MNKKQCVSDIISDFYKTKHKNKFKKNEKITEVQFNKTQKDNIYDTYSDLDLNEEHYISNEIDKFYKNKHKQEKINEKLIIRHINEKHKGGIHKIYSNLKVRICKIVTDQQLKFKFSYSKLIGCSIGEFDEYIKSKFKEGMSIDNYGEWELDHIYPVSKFDFTKEDEFFRCFNYKNIQPLWKTENRKKYNKIMVAVSDDK